MADEYDVPEPKRTRIERRAAQYLAEANWFERNLFPLSFVPDTADEDTFRDAAIKAQSLPVSAQRVSICTPSGSRPTPRRTWRCSVIPAL
jgi:hypothetical protein